MRARTIPRRRGGRTNGLREDTGLITKITDLQVVLCKATADWDNAATAKRVPRGHVTKYVAGPSAVMVYEPALRL
jgi:hypothetical protein